MKATEFVTEESAKSCPPATQDITLNLKNRQKAIDEYGYGPLNPDLPNTKFWQAKVDEWNLDSVDEAKSSLCGNCAAFDQREATLACIAKGIGSDAGAEDPTIEAGDLGYCRFLKFKCASRRTCDAWVTGGPLTDDKQKATEGMEPIGGPWKSGEFSRILNAFQVYTNTMGYGMEFYNWANRSQALKLLADKSGTTPELVKHTLDSLNWGQHPEEEFDDEEPVDENLHDWFGKEKWVRMDTKGNIKGDCARGSSSEGKPKCLPQAKAHALGKKGRASAAQKKRRQDPNPERSGKAINVATRVKESTAPVDYTKFKLSRSGGQEEKYTVFNLFYNGKFVGDIGYLKADNTWFVGEPMGASYGALQGKYRDANRYANKDQALQALIKAVEPQLNLVAEDELDEKWSAKYKSSINCSHPKGFSQKAHCAGKKKHNEDITMEAVCPDCGMCETHGDPTRDTIDEACWKGYHKEGNKELFGKTVPNCVKNEAVAEGHESCPECGGAMYPDTMINEKQDACYYKVKSRYKVWPSAYASGALVQCRKKGAANWGNKSKNESQENMMDELSRILELSTGLSLEARAELVEEFDLIESIIDDIAEHNGVDSEVIWEDLESLTDDELYVFATTTTIMETEAWQKANKRDKTDGMSRKAVKTYRREHPGSKLQTAVTTKPSKLKKGSKASKRRKSYCSRSRGQMKMHNISCAKTPDKAICKARRRWNC